MSDKPSMVDWELAARVGTRLAGPGPEVSSSEAAEAVAELRQGAATASPLVRAYTGLVTEAGTAPVRVVDRAGWIEANLEGFAQLVTPLVDRLTEKRGDPGRVARAVGSRVSGTEVGAMLGFLSGRVLGQFDPFHGAGAVDDPGSVVGRLLLVAPNVVQVERDLDVDATDFRLWVCLHEETHRVQFTAVPWLRDHLYDQVRALADGIGTDPAEMVGQVVRRAREIIGGGTKDMSLAEIFASPEQREVIDRVTGVMSLLEGHADVVMDGVGPEVIPSVGAIRRKFTQRRKGVGVLDRLVRRLMGMDQKMAQYRDGAVFVRSVVDKVGMDGFNAIWTEPATLPSKAEIHAPETWLARVHG
ncbi:hypothetical protein GCM10011519_26030 [Marmoricola endophyticus]|uniref:Coenzyme F420 biosynthesis-associated protein n=1 Tax=Marmoricola endophyticus TaxID=2040280 RepID=A0A917F4Z3_9ACTN|nr:zinc-dependent metalloprotease [Marmoricola endophyticus]GGF50836.1 hypothetical protein GCM10011519_26030 [Marmoricola endophyticus]